MKRTIVLVLALVAAVLSSAAPAARASAGSILFYGPTIQGSPDTEATLAQAAGYQVTVADAQMATIQLTRLRFHGDWNYAIRPATP